MIPLVPSTQAAPAAGWNISALWNDMLRSWIAHHQRMADLGLHGSL